MALIVVQSLLGSITSEFSLCSFLIWSLILACLFSFKNIPLMWHLRLVAGVLYHSRWKSSEILKSQADDVAPIFQSLMTRTRSPIYECDINGHKSDSTYFTDLDINRFHLISKLCKGVFNPSLLSKPSTVKASAGGEIRLKGMSVALGGTSCIFRREIKPYARFEIHSRVLTWDSKWMYIISHFVQPNSYRDIKRRSNGMNGSSNEKSAGQTEQCRRVVYASALSQYVFKAGRDTVEPASALPALGLLPAKPMEMGYQTLGDNEWSRIEERRLKGLEMAEHLLKLGEMHNLFEETVSLPSLGFYGLLGERSM